MGKPFNESADQWWGRRMALLSPWSVLFCLTSVAATFFAEVQGSSQSLAVLLPFYSSFTSSLGVNNVQFSGHKIWIRNIKRHFSTWCISPSVEEVFVLENEAVGTESR